MHFLHDRALERAIFPASACREYFTATNAAEHFEKTDTGEQVHAATCKRVIRKVAPCEVNATLRLESLEFVRIGGRSVEITSYSAWRVG